MARYQVRLIEKREIAEGTMAFRFEKPADFVFKAGQHIDIVFENPVKTDEKGNGRDLSIASAPYEPWLEVATRITDSAFKQNLNKTPVGTELLVKGPGGDFYLHEDGTRPALFLTGGIGITPMRSMILDATYRKLPHNIFLFYSNHTPQSASYLLDFVKAAKENPNFILIATMTNLGGSHEPWSGERGVINRAMLRKHLPDTAFPVYYLAGPEGMVKAMRALAKSAGADDLSIRAEEFPGY